MAEQRHVGRAADRLHMSQPPLSRAVRQLEDDLGVALFDRTPKGVTLTPAGVVLFDEARALLEQADRVRAHVTATAGTTTLAVGTLVDTAEQLGSGLVAAFRARHRTSQSRSTRATSQTPPPDCGPVSSTSPSPERRSTTRTSPPSCCARTRSGPFCTDDPLAGRASVSLQELRDHPWVRLPEGVDPKWTEYWSGGTPSTDLPVVRTIQECLQSVLWSRTAALAPLNQALPAGLVTVRVVERSASDVVVAWKRSNPSPLIRSFVQVAASEPWANRQR